MAMNLVDMARPKTMRDLAVATDPPNYHEPRYPYGLKLDLCEEELKKLGLDADDFILDEDVMVYAKAKICRTSKSEYQCEDGEIKSNQTVELQVTHLQLIPAAAGSLRELFKMVK